jgi:hypothetical protein
MAGDAWFSGDQGENHALSPDKVGSGNARAHQLGRLSNPRALGTQLTASAGLGASTFQELDTFFLDYR